MWGHVVTAGLFDYRICVLFIMVMGGFQKQHLVTFALRVHSILWRCYFNGEADRIINRRLTFKTWKLQIGALHTCPLGKWWKFCGGEWSQHLRNDWNDWLSLYFFRQGHFRFIWQFTGARGRKWREHTETSTSPHNNIKWCSVVD